MFLPFKRSVRNVIDSFLSLLSRHTDVFSGGKKKVLMVVPNVLTFAYLQLLFQHLRQEPNICITFCFDKDIPNDTVTRLLATIEGEARLVNVVSYRFAMFFPWELIFFADITVAHQSFSSKSKKIRIEHGLPSGKRDRSGYDVSYSDGLLDCHGNIAYNAILSPANTIPFAAVSPNVPDLSDKHYPSGCLRMDLLLERVSLQKEARNKFKIMSDKKVVFITSSWGEHSLIKQWGSEFYDDLERLSNKYYFIVTVHPHNYKKLHYKGTVTEDTFKEFKAKGGIVVAVEQDWVPYLACSDILVTDYTSLSLYFVALKRPIVCLKLPPNIGMLNAEMYRMEKISTSVGESSQLEAALEVAEQSNISEEHIRLAKDVCSYQGDSWKHMRSVILATLYQ